MSLLIGLDSAEFNFLLKETGATRGNLSIQISKLKDAGYIDVHKTFRNNYPLTTCKITPKGVEAFERYVETIKQYLNIK
jgi:DNA-binding PadR family transcriptional regulator